MVTARTPERVFQKKRAPRLKFSPPPPIQESKPSCAGRPPVAGIGAGLPWETPSIDQIRDAALTAAGPKEEAGRERIADFQGSGARPPRRIASEEAGIPPVG